MAHLRVPSSLLALAVAAPLSCGYPTARDPTFVPGARTGIWRPDSTSVALAEQHTGFTSAGTFVIADSVTWQGVWHQVYSVLIPPPAVASVDFSTWHIAFAALGTRGSTGYQVSIDSVVLHQNGGVAFVREVQPGQHCGTGAALSEPVVALRIPTTLLIQQWQSEVTVYDC